MLTFLTENYNTDLEKIFNENCLFPSVDDILSQKIILYGAGSLGTMAIDLMNKKELSLPSYIVDKSKNGSIGAVKVIKPDEISPGDKEEALFLICVSTLPYNDIEAFLKVLGCKHLMHFYTWAYLIMPELFGDGWFKPSLSTDEKESIEKVCESLSHDECSLAHYFQFLWWRLRLKEVKYKNYPVLSGKKYFKSPILPLLGEHETLLDGGVHLGQTIESFIEKINNKYEKIYAFEPDKTNLQTTKEKFQDRRIVYSGNALYKKSTTLAFRDGLGSASKIDDNGLKVQAVMIDDLNIKPTIIKLHIEGSELEVLEGAKKTIEKCHPILMVLADHCEDGLYKIPQFIYNLPEYKLYFNLHDYCGNTAVFYGISLP
jgi:FkbM family methyltransferase